MSSLARATLSTRRFQKFAPADTSSLELPAQLTRADLDALLARIERDQSRFDDPDALTAYVRAQRALLTDAPVASPGADDRVIVDDIVPKRAPVAAPPPEPEPAVPLPEGYRAVYVRAGFDEGQMARAVKLNLDPRTLMELLHQPRPEGAPQFKARPAPQNTAEHVLAALEAGVPLERMRAYHQVGVPVAQHLEALQAGFEPDTLGELVSHGVSVSEAIALRDAGLGGSGYAARQLKRSTAPIDVFLSAHRAGMSLSDFARAAQRPGNRPEQVIALWNTCDRRLFDEAPWLTSQYSTDELAQLFDAGLLDFDQPVNVIEDELKQYREDGVSMTDQCRVARAGGSASGLSSALHRGLTIDHYLQLAAMRAPPDAADLMLYCDGFDTLLRLLSTGLGVKDLQRSLRHFGFDVEQTVTLARCQVDPYQAKVLYLDRGLSHAEAVEVIEGGG
ncbi:MAG: hypothetical protein IPJ65_34040 [Archangiaceae bacterium]|nr:hypothetical protein [Archangiaceae bacterium]